MDINNATRSQMLGRLSSDATTQLRGLQDQGIIKAREAFDDPSVFGHARKRDYDTVYGDGDGDYLATYCHASMSGPSSIGKTSLWHTRARGHSIKILRKEEFERRHSRS
jgi:hypothetical protein